MTNDAYHLLFLPLLKAFFAGFLALALARTLIVSAFHYWQTPWVEFDDEADQKSP